MCCSRKFLKWWNVGLLVRQHLWRCGQSEGACFGEETDKPKDEDGFVSNSGDVSIGEASKLKFSELGRKWFLVFGVSGSIQGITQEDWQSYMDFLLGLAKLGSGDGRIPTFEDFVNAVSEVLIKVVSKDLEEEIKGKVNEFDEYSVSRRSCLFFLLKGAALKFRDDAEKNLDLYAVWTAWKRCGSLFSMLDGVNNLGKDIEGLKSTEVILRGLLTEKKVLERSSLECIEVVSEEIEDSSLVGVYRKFLDKAREKTMELLKDANLQIKRVFLSSAQNYVRRNDIFPFVCLSDPGVEPFQCFFGADLLENGTTPVLELCYWLSLEKLTRKKWNLARFVRALRPEVEQQCCLCRNGVDVPITLMEGPSLARKERREVVNVFKHAGACAAFKPKDLMLDGCNGECTDLNPQPFTCGQKSTTGEKSLIRYNADGGALTVPGKANLYFALVYKGFSRKVQGQTVLDFVIRDENDKVYFSFPGGMLPNGQSVVFKIFVAETDLLLAKSYYDYSRKFLNSEMRICYDQKSECLKKCSLESLNRMLRKRVEKTLNSFGLAIYNKTGNDWSACSKNLQILMDEDNVAELEEEILALLEEEIRPLRQKNFFDGLERAAEARKETFRKLDVAANQRGAALEGLSVKDLS